MNGKEETNSYENIYSGYIKNQRAVFKLFHINSKKSRKNTYLFLYIVYIYTLVSNGYIQLYLYNYSSTR